MFVIIVPANVYLPRGPRNAYLHENDDFHIIVDPEKKKASVKLRRHLGKTTDRGHIDYDTAMSFVERGTVYEIAGIDHTVRWTCPHCKLIIEYVDTDAEQFEREHDPSQFCGGHEYVVDLSTSSGPVWNETDWSTLLAKIYVMYPGGEIDEEWNPFDYPMYRRYIYSSVDIFGEHHGHSHIVGEITTKLTGGRI